jgi:hypothetical protein
MEYSEMISCAKALFDPEYLPNKLLHRDQELETLANIISPDDASTPVNIMVHGSFGIGRTTLLRFWGNQRLGTWSRPLINFHMKTDAEIVHDTLTTLTGSSPPFAPLPELWSLLKRILRKAETPIIFTLDDIDRHNCDAYTKYLSLCKSLGISSMATAPRYFPRQLDQSAATQLDFSLELEPFSDHQFLDIITQRVTDAFPTPLPPFITEYIADVICILDFQRPATAVELLRNLYPLTTENTSLTSDQIRQACLSSRALHYDFWSDHLAHLTNLEATTALLLQAVGEYFTVNPGQIYVTESQLLLQYQQVCECTEIAPKNTKFQRALNELLFQDLLLRSRYNSEKYFTLLPAQGYFEIVELILGDKEEC